ncbi:hypothetical protein ABIE73_002019 [Bradyrhizobium yuanmingense]
MLDDGTNLGHAGHGRAYGCPSPFRAIRSETCAQGANGPASKPAQSRATTISPDITVTSRDSLSAVAQRVQRREMVVTKTINAQLSTLARSARNAYARTKEARSGFISGTFELAAAFSAARKKLPSDQAFHEWIDKARLRCVSRDDRAALIYIGNHAKAARQYFMQNPDRWSWRMCMAHLSIRAPVSQPAKPLPSPARTINVQVTHETLRLASPYYRGTSEVKRLPAPFRLVTNETHEQEYMTPAKALQTHRPDEAIGAVQAVIEASSLPTRDIALYWQMKRGEPPSSEQLRKAAQWLDLLADALEADPDCKQRHH